MRTSIRAATAKPGYLPTLDGWRAVAILSVIFVHDRLYSWGSLSTGWLHEHGGNGVNLFFAISGLLICWRLLEEERAFGRISLSNFYTRRAFRILPPAFVFLLAVAVLSLAKVLHIGVRDWLGALLFYQNYTSLLGTRGPDSVFVGQFWSLAVEEHFYLILPALLVLTRKRWRVPVLLSVALLVEIHRWRLLQSHPWRVVGHHTDVLLDLLMIPAILAVLVQGPVVRLGLARWLRFWPLLFALTVGLITFWSDSFWEITAAAVLMPLMLLGSVLNPGGILARALEWAPLRYIGRISYSLYLWHQLFIISHVYVGKLPLGVLQRPPMEFLCVLACSIASYHLVERPMIKLGHRLAPPATPGRDDLRVQTEPSSGEPIKTIAPRRATMRDRTSLAVVITNYNSWALTQRCAQQCLAHDEDRIDTLLIYDDGSSSAPPDNMPGKARVIRAAENRGLPKSLNTAVRMTSEELVVVFDSDAYPMTPFCRAASDMFSEDPGLGLIAFRTLGSRGQNTESYSAEPNIWSILLGQALCSRLQSWIVDRSGRLSVFTCAMAVRRQAFDEIGGFDEGFDWLDLDHDFSMRMNQSRWRSAVCEGPRVFHEGGGSPQLTRHRVLRFYKNRWYLLSKFNRIPAAGLVKLLIGLRLRTEYLVLLLFGQFLFRDPAMRNDKLVGRRELVRFWSQV